MTDVENQERIRIPSVVWSHYVGKEHSYEMLYPFDWTMREIPIENIDSDNTLNISPAIRCVDFCYSANDVDINVMIVKEPLPKDVQLREYYQLCKQQFQKSGIPLTSVTVRDVKLSEIDAKQFTYSPLTTIDISRRFTIKDHHAITITCESRNNQTLDIEPVFERMMDSFCFLEEQSGKSENNLYLYENYEEMISLEFPPDLKYSHDSGLISLYDESDPNSVFEVQCIEPPTDEAVLGDLSSTYEYFIKDISESVTPSKPESFYIPEIDCNGLEFTLSGVSPNVSSNQITRIAMFNGKLYCWSLTQAGDSQLKSLFSTFKFLV